MFNIIQESHAVTKDIESGQVHENDKMYMSFTLVSVVVDLFETSSP